MSVRHALLAVLLGAFAVSAFASLQLPSNITTEATSAGGAVVTYNAGVNGSGDDENGRPLVSAICSPASGSQFALGSTSVQCSGSDGSQGSFLVNVVDTSGPVLQLPRDFSVPASSANGAAVTYNATASDRVDGPVSVTCIPASGSFFATGTTTVSCSAVDARNNMTSGTFAVTVIPQPPPPPSFHDITAEATGPNGAVVNYVVSGSGDDENGRPTQNANCAPASGSTFPLGITTVQCIGGSFKITIVDTTPPALFLPNDITSQSQTVTFSATAQDIVDGAVGVTCNPPSGSTFAAGTTTVNCSASDTRGNTSSGTFNVTVEQSPTPDTEPPTIVSLSANPGTLQPPNGKLVTVAVTADVFDNIDDSPFVGIFDVTANETIGDDDFDIQGPLTVKLRADRDPHGTGRVYTLWIEAIDDAGNRSVGTTTVTVPHDSSGDITVQPPSKRRRTVRG